MYSSGCVPNHLAECSTAILGGGPAGLSVAYHLAKVGVSSHLFEAESTVGGACRTKDFAGLRYDMGAHRLHAVLSEVTQEMKDLLGAELAVVNAPSHIYHEGKPVLFPPSPLGLAKALGFWRTAASLAPLLVSHRSVGKNFREDAIAKYGRPVAESFLVNYSEKLWGLPAERLSAHISGKRLQGLGLRAALCSLVGLKHSEHLDGSFLYPRRGFGSITDALAASLQHVHTGARVQRLLHKNNEVGSVLLADGRRFDAQNVVSSLPIPSLLRMLDPAPPQSILDLISALKYRSVRLAILVVDAAFVSHSASLYFPCANVPFTRIYEPKRRSSAMAPGDRTCLVLECPVFPGDRIDSLSQEAFLSMSRRALFSTGLTRKASVIEQAADMIPDAYPVLDVDAARPLAAVAAYLGRFTNLHRVGRAARFQYSHFHDLMQDGRLLAERLTNRACPAACEPFAKPIDTRTLLEEKGSLS